MQSLFFGSAVCPKVEDVDDVTFLRVVVGISRCRKLEYMPFMKLRDKTGWDWKKSVSKGSTCRVKSGSVGACDIWK